MSNSKTFRLFISSTFNDFRKEREVLQTKVFPHAKEYCSQRGYTFQPIDLRWGVSNEAQLDQKTLELCLSEVRACKSHVYPNFLIMIGNRYGWIPLPYAIEVNEFKKLEDIIEKDDGTLTIEYKKYKVYDDTNDETKFHYKQKEARAVAKLELLKQWYSLDENQLPSASYILNERNKDYAIYENWEAEENILRTILQSAVKTSNLNEEQKRKYFLSATEAEVEEGVIPYIKPTKYQTEQLLSKDTSLLHVDPEHIFGFFRDIDKSTQIENKFIMDDYEEAQLFKERVANELMKNNILHVKTTQTDKESLEETYLKEFEARMIKFLESQVDAQKAKEADEKLTPLQIELQAQSYFAQTKRKDFLETEHLKELLESIQRYISDDTQQTLVIYGPSGRGKSSLMSKAIQEAEESLQKKVLYRFVGATPNSSSSQEILISMFDELGIDVRMKKEKEKQESDKEDESFEDFSYRINGELINLEEDITIFIDAVDQLQNHDQFLWIPSKLPHTLKIIISALEDEKYKDDSRYFATLKTKTETIHEIEEFSEPKQLLTALLKKEDRTLQEDQEAYFLKQFQSSPSPLYVSIAVQEIKNWKSYDYTEGSTPKEDGVEQNLKQTQQGIIKEFVENLHTVYHHNKEFVNKVLGYLYASRDGLSESELLQLISADESFIQKMAPETWHENPTKELPMVHWSRLHTQLKPFLSSKTVDSEELMYLFHREFEDVIAKLPNQIEEHEAVIKANQGLITNNQDKGFNENRWGRLYIVLTCENYFRYKKYKDFIENSEWIVREKNDIWIDGILIYLRDFDLILDDSSENVYKAEGLEAFYAHEEQQLHEEKKVNSASIIKMLENAPSHIEIFLYAIDAYSKVQLSQTIKEYIKPCLSRIKTLRAWGIYTKKIQDELLLLLARFYQEDLDEWLWEYKKALSEFEKYSDYLDKLKVLYKRNPEKWQEEYIKEVVIGSNDIDLLTDAYQICKNTQESKLNDMYIQIANELTTKYISINSFLKAEEILKESLSHLEPDKDDNLLIDTWIILIDCYKQQEFFSKAILYQEKILKIRESVYTKKIKLYKNSDFGHIGHILSYYIKDYLNALDELGFSYYMLKRFEEAIILEEKSYLILQDLYKKESEEWVEAYTISLSNLASSYSKQNRQSEAIVLREESLEILRELYKENSDRWIENYATSLDDLASSIGKQKDFKKASELFETYFDVSDFENQDDITYFMYPFIKWYQCEQRLGKSNAIERLDDLALKLIGLYKEKLAEEYKVVINQEYDTYLPLKDSEDEFTREKYEIFVKIFTK